MLQQGIRDSIKGNLKADFDQIQYIECNAHEIASFMFFLSSLKLLSGVSTEHQHVDVDGNAINFLTRANARRPVTYVHLLDLW